MRVIPGRAPARTGNLGIFGSGAEPVIGRRKAPTRWDHPGMTRKLIEIKAGPTIEHAAT
jgi:hypothetical protein